MVRALSRKGREVSVLEGGLKQTGVGVGRDAGDNASVDAVAAMSRVADQMLLAQGGKIGAGDDDLSNFSRDAGQEGFG